MIRELTLKPDFAKTVERFEAWWQGELIDRPPTTVRVRSKPPTRVPFEPAPMRRRWLEVEYVVDNAIAHLESQQFLGDMFPIFWPNVGPEITATIFGCELEYDANTSWSTPVVHDLADWQRIIDTPANFDNPYWQAMERMTDLAIEKSAGRYIVGMTDLHGNYDILAGLRDPEMLCVDLLDDPDLIRRAGAHVAAGYVESYHRLYRKVAAAGMGTTTWTPIYHEGPAYVPSSDFWCLVSDQIARDMILPDIITEMKPLQRSIFHLDGPQALRHLGMLLDLPQLNALQWVYGAGNGRASNWIHVYKRALAAHKSVQIYAVDPDDALTVLDALGPRGVWLDVQYDFDSTESAKSFLAEVDRRSLGHLPLRGNPSQK